MKKKWLTLAGRPLHQSKHSLGTPFSWQQCRWSEPSEPQVISLSNSVKHWESNIKKSKSRLKVQMPWHCCLTFLSLQHCIKDSVRFVGWLTTTLIPDSTFTWDIEFMQRRLYRFWKFWGKITSFFPLYNFAPKCQ